jgi:hypothetical protein
MCIYIKIDGYFLKSTTFAAFKLNNSQRCRKTVVLAPEDHQWSFVYLLAPFFGNLCVESN